MAGAVEILTLDELARRFTAAGDALRRDAVPEKVRREVVQLVVADCKSNIAEGRTPDGGAMKPLAHPRARGGNKPLRDTGRLMASITGQWPAGGDLTATSNLEHAAIHQYGGVIVPKSGSYLAIPLTRPAATAGSPRSFSGELVPIFGQRGGVLASPSKNGKPGVAHFALVDRVVIPARPYLGFGERLITKLQGVLGQALEETIIQRLFRFFFGGR